jgi:Domain of unknown function (DUF1937)
MSGGYWYIGGPYSKYPDGLDAAFDEVCRIAGWFAQAGFPVYSPIAHCHPIAKASGLNPHDHKIWLPFCEPVMTGSKGLIVAKMATWDESFGLQQEIVYFNSARKPIRYLDPATMLLDDEPLELAGRRDAARLAA